MKTALFGVGWEGCLSPRGKIRLFVAYQCLGGVLVDESSSVPLYFKLIFGDICSTLRIRFVYFVHLTWVGGF